MKSKGVTFEEAKSIRKHFENKLFSDFPSLNTLCIKEINNDNKFQLIAGVTKNLNTDKNSLIKNGIHSNTSVFPTFLEVSKSELNSDKNNVLNNFSKSTIKSLLSYPNDEIRIPIVQKQTNEITTNNIHRKRPLISGIAIGNPEYSFSGTLGAICKLKNKKGFYILSNWHVLAGIHGEMNDHIIQPNIDLKGKLENNQDFVAKLIWYRLDKYMDVALAKINSKFATSLLANKTKAFITEPPKLGNQVIKSNFLGNQEGKIISTNCTAKIKGRSYPGGSTIIRNLIITEKISTPGDSGTLVYNKNTKNIVGLIVGGDNELISVINPLHFKKPITPINSSNYNISKLENIIIESYI